MTDRTAIWNEAMAPNPCRLLEEIRRSDTLPVFHHPCGCRDLRHTWLAPHNWQTCLNWQHQAAAIRARKIGEVPYG